MLKAHEGGPEIESVEEIFPKKCRHVTGKMPESVAIVALGPSQSQWFYGNGTYERAVPPVDEVWSLNKGLRTIKADVGWILDDLVGEARRSEEYANDIRNFNIPIITTTIDHDVKELFPKVDLHEYPMQEIIWQAGVRYGVVSGQKVADLKVNGESIRTVGKDLAMHFQNSVPMMIAYALYIGVRRLYLYGVDYSYPGQEANEKGRANCSYWVGFTRGQAMQVHINRDSTLMDTRDPLFIYGYARPPVIGIPTPEDVTRILGELGLENG